jgi:esterase/lipase
MPPFNDSRTVATTASTGPISSITYADSTDTVLTSLEKINTTVKNLSDAFQSRFQKLEQSTLDTSKRLHNIEQRMSNQEMKTRTIESSMDDRLEEISTKIVEANQTQMDLLLQKQETANDHMMSFSSSTEHQLKLLLSNLRQRRGSLSGVTSPTVIVRPSSTPNTTLESTQRSSRHVDHHDE